MSVYDGVCTNCPDTIEDTLNTVYILPTEVEQKYNDYIVQSENGVHVSLSDFFTCIVLPVLLLAAGLTLVHTLNN
jgi:hypothetical protein